MIKPAASPVDPSLSYTPNKPLFISESCNIAFNALKAKQQPADDNLQFSTVYTPEIAIRLGGPQGGKVRVLSSAITMPHTPGSDSTQSALLRAFAEAKSFYEKAKDKDYDFDKDFKEHWLHRDIKVELEKRPGTTGMWARIINLSCGEPSEVHIDDEEMNNIALIASMSTIDADQPEDARAAARGEKLKERHQALVDTKYDAALGKLNGLSIAHVPSKLVLERDKTRDELEKKKSSLEATYRQAPADLPGILQDLKDAKDGDESVDAFRKQLLAAAADEAGQARIKERIEGKLKDIKDAEALMANWSAGLDEFSAKLDEAEKLAARLAAYSS